MTITRPLPRRVTVLFVDVRGYTGFSETRQAEEVFRTVNRYTETVLPCHAAVAR